jgi:ABC-type lipoprotein release transport system permease subunit
MMALLHYALGSAFRRGARNLAIALGLAFTIALIASGIFITESLRAVHQRAVREAPSLLLERLEGGRPALIPVDAAARFQSILGVRGVRPRVWGYTFLGAAEGNIVVFGESGRDADHVTVGPGLARLLGLRIGDRLALSTSTYTHVYRIDALLPASTALVAHDAVIVGEGEARQLLNIPEGMATDIALDVFPPEEIGAVEAQIVEAEPTFRIVNQESASRLYTLTFDARGGILLLLYLPCLAALLLLAWDRFSGLSTEERREIGVLKAIGWSTENVLGVRMLESSLVALSGTVLGILVAYVHVFVFEAPLFTRLLFGWSTLHAPLLLAPSTDIATLLALIAIVVVPFVSISAIPAWRAATIDPDRAMRGA